MKTRILYVGTLVDLALIFEPDEDEEQGERNLIINFKIKKVIKELKKELDIDE